MNLLLITVAIQVLGTLVSSDSGNAVIRGPHERLIKAIGSDGQLIDELSKISTYASSLRNGIGNHFEDNWIEGYHGFVQPLTFDDGIKWVAKVREFNIYNSHSIALSQALLY